MNPEDVTFALALEDFVPVILTTIAVTLLARWSPRRRVAGFAGVILIAAGGLGKATWKLLAVGWGLDLHILADALFYCLGPGFMLVAWSLLKSAGARAHWFIPIALTIGALGAAVAVGDDYPVLILTITGATGTAVALVLLGRARRDRVAVIASAIWIAGQYALGPLATHPDQTLALQWIEQLSNTLAQATLLVAAWRITRTKVTTSDTRPLSTQEAPA